MRFSIEEHKSFEYVFYGDTVGEADINISDFIASKQMYFSLPIAAGALQLSFKMYIELKNTKASEELFVMPKDYNRSVSANMYTEGSFMFKAYGPEARNMRSETAVDPSDESYDHFVTFSNKVDFGEAQNDYEQKIMMKTSVVALEKYDSTIYERKVAEEADEKMLMKRHQNTQYKAKEEDVGKG